MEYRFEDGWRKVRQDGGDYVTGVLFNIVTEEATIIKLADYDYTDGSRDNPFWHEQMIDEEAVKQWRHKNGFLCEGDFVEVFKGRKVPKGTKGTITKFRDVYDRYGRWVAKYVVLDTGHSTNIENCRMA